MISSINSISAISLLTGNPRNNCSPCAVCDSVWKGQRKRNAELLRQDLGYEVRGIDLVSWRENRADGGRLKLDSHTYIVSQWMVPCFIQK